MQVNEGKYIFSMMTEDLMMYRTKPRALLALDALLRSDRLEYGRWLFQGLLSAAEITICPEDEGDYE